MQAYDDDTPQSIPLPPNTDRTQNPAVGNTFQALWPEGTSGRLFWFNDSPYGHTVAFDSQGSTANGYYVPAYHARLITPYRPVNKITYGVDPGTTLNGSGSAPLAFLFIEYHPLDGLPLMPDQLTPIAERLSNVGNPIPLSNTSVQVDGTNANTGTSQILSQDAGVGLATRDNLGGSGLIEVYPVSGSGDRGAMLDYLSGGSALNGIGVNKSGQVVVGSAVSPGLPGVPVIVARALSVAVTVTTLQTILSFTPPATGFYRISGWVFLNNGTQPQSPKAQVSFTDADANVNAVRVFTESGRQQQIVAGAVAPLVFDGSSSGMPNGGYALYSMTIHASSAAAINCQYQDGANTPNDSITFFIERLA